MRYALWLKFRFSLNWYVATWKVLKVSGTSKKGVWSLISSMPTIFVNSIGFPVCFSALCWTRSRTLSTCFDFSIFYLLYAHYFCCLMMNHSELGGTGLSDAIFCLRMLIKNVLNAVTRGLRRLEGLSAAWGWARNSLINLVMLPQNTILCCFSSSRCHNFFLLIIFKFLFR